MTTEQYNGWSNYTTWRVHLEIIDGINFVHDDITSEDREITVEEVAEFLETVVENTITQNGEIKGLAVDYATAFCEDVNYREIAEHIIAENPSIIKN